MREKVVGSMDQRFQWGLKDFQSLDTGESELER